MADVEEVVSTDTYNEGSSERIACPWCGEMKTDLWDYNWGSREEIEVECGYCDKPFLLSRIVSVDYTARRVVKP